MRRGINGNISASLYFCLLCCLSGCSTEEAAENISNKSEVLVTVNLNETSWNTEQSISQTKAPVAKASIPVAGGVLTATLEPSTDAQTRSTDMSNGVRYRVIAYAENDISYAGYVNHADFVKGGVSPAFWLQTDKTYTLVCYSYNTAEPIPEFHQWQDRIFDVNPENDFLYCKKNVTITADNRSFSLELAHSFSELTVIVDASPDGEGYTISACSGTLSPYYFAAVFLADGHRMKESIVSKSINWTSLGAVMATSTPMLVYNEVSNINECLKLTLESITIDGTTILTNYSFKFNEDMLAGCKYTFRVKFYSEYRNRTVTWAPSNLIYANGTYSFATTPEFRSGVWNGGDYWNWRVLDPTDNTSNSSEYTTPPVDPCKKVAPAGTWRMPRKEEFDILIKSGYVWANKNGVPGMYFGTTTVPASGSEKNYVFLPAAGRRYSGVTTIASLSDYGYYWSATPSFNYAYYLFVMEGLTMTSSFPRTDGYAVRCVSEK